MPDSVTINLSRRIKFGQSQLLARTRVQDLRDIKKAAVILNMSQSEFMRTVLVNAARTILAGGIDESN